MLHLDIFNFLKLYPLELAISDLSDYKQYKPYSYFATIQPLCCHNLNDAEFSDFKAKRRRSERLNENNG